MSMFRSSLIFIVFILFSLEGNSQNNTQQLYYKSLEYALNDIKPNKLDSFYVMAEEGVITVPKVLNINLKVTDAIFFEGLCCDTSFWLLKTMPIEISREGLIVPVGYYNFKQRDKERNMIFIASYYSYFRFDCKDQVYRLYKREKKTL